MPAITSKTSEGRENQQLPSPSDAPAHNGTPKTAVGPHPSVVVVAKQYMSEDEIQHYVKERGFTEQQKKVQRTVAISFLADLRCELELPAQTYATASQLYMRFCLINPKTDYSYYDAICAAMFAACKIEDTLKKSKEILVAAHKIRNPSSEVLTVDDPYFETPQKAIWGLERLIYEANAFDFRVRKPLSYMVKIAKHLGLPESFVTSTLWATGLDLYRTYVPLKCTTFAMALACIEFAALLENRPDEFAAAMNNSDMPRYNVERDEIMEVMQDLCDLYTSYLQDTMLGTGVPIEEIIRVRISLNQEMEEKKLLRYAAPKEEVESSPQTPIPGTGIGNLNSDESLKGKVPGRDITYRYMLDPLRARQEWAAIAKFFNDEYEEEVETVTVYDDPPSPEPEPKSRIDPPRSRPDHGRGRGRGRGRARGKDLRGRRGYRRSRWLS